MLTPQFQRRPFLWLNIAAAALFASWVLPATRPLWEALDERVFAVLHGTLDPSGPGAWNAFWALVNARWFDLLAFTMMGALMTACCAAHGRRRIISGLALFPALLILLILARESLEALADVRGWNHMSPSLRDESAVFLSRFYPDWGTKDNSLASFPGDHAGVLFLWLGYCLYLARNRWTLLAAVFTGLNLLPRLVSGAHAVSDELVGGGVAALVALSVGLCTPLCVPAMRGLAAGLNLILAPLRGHALTPAWIETLAHDSRAGEDSGERAQSR